MSKYNVSFEPRFLNDLKEAKRYLNEQREGLGKKLAIEVKNTLKKIQQNPNFEIKYDEIRWVKINKFRYIIHFYLDIKSNNIIFLALFHTSQNTEKYPKK
jgi:mRNA-degrading endonuclease RelE of RelBE toxin-antitoxin system